MLRTLGFNWNRRNARHANRSRNYNTFSENGECRSMEQEVFDATLLDVSTSSGDTSTDSESIEVIKTKLRWHYMNPYQKFKLRKRKPWKLLLQILKIFLVTAQILLFGNDRFSQVSFYDDNTQAFYDIFLNGNTTDFSLYVIPDVYESMFYAHTQYYKLHKAVGSYSIQDEKNETVPMTLVTHRYVTGNISSNSYSFNTDVVTSRINLLPPSSNKATIANFLNDNNITHEFDSLIYFALNFNIKTIHLKELKPSDKPDCINFTVNILYDNARHDGRIFVSLVALPSTFKCSGKVNGNAGETILRNAYIMYDCVVIIVCVMSFALCSRSIIKHLHLAQKVGRYFQRSLNQRLSISDYIEFINMWFILIILSDVLTISGSICKILIDIKVYGDYDVCSLFLGLGVLLVWIGLLRYLTFLRKYNILLVTLKASAPSVLRFCLCAAVLYFGFIFCGWIVLGPYHPKFRDIFTVSECLFSLLNGDDMFMTFKEMQKRSYAAWIFSKIYLYTFISLFIYVVLSLFIGIISDTYERMKDWGHPPCSKLQKFVHGVQCSRCRSEQGIQDDQTPQTS